MFSSHICNSGGSILSRLPHWKSVPYFTVLTSSVRGTPSPSSARLWVAIHRVCGTPSLYLEPVGLSFVVGPSCGSRFGLVICGLGFVGSGSSFLLSFTLVGRVRENGCFEWWGHFLQLGDFGDEV
jgi:hypothetical protein